MITIDEFIEKYVGILKNISKKLDDEYCLDINERERLSGYNNAIVFVLSLINPLYEYELDSNMQS